MTEILKERFKGMSQAEIKYEFFKMLVDKKDKKSITREMYEYFNEDEIFDVMKEVAKTLIIGGFAKGNTVSDEVYLSYNQILTKCLNLSKELNLSKSIEIANLFTYLLWNGYFSKSKTNIYKIEGRKNIGGYFALDIMDGVGVCLNHADMLKDLINMSKYSAVILPNVVDKNAKIEYRPNIDRKIKNPRMTTQIFQGALAGISKKLANHAFTLIIEENGIYIYDSTNVLLLKINDDTTANVLNGEGVFKIKPYFSYKLTSTDKDQKALDTFFHTKKINLPYSSKDYEALWEKDLELFNINANLIEDFYDCIREDIYLIANT